MVAILHFFSAMVIAGSLSLAAAATDDEDTETRISRCNPETGSVHQFLVETLDGGNASMSRYKGNVVLIVNVATFCRYTEQYLDFNPLASRYSNLGVYMAAFPCNQFHLQEPADNNEILNGIKYVRPGNGFTPASNLHVYGKLDVNGRDAHPMYKFLKNACPPTGDVMGEMQYLYWDQVRTSDVVWNFEKFIVDRRGRPVYRFHPGAWDHGRVVEKYLKEALNGDPGAGAQSRPLVQSPSNFIIQDTSNTSRPNANDTMRVSKFSSGFIAQPPFKAPESILEATAPPIIPAPEAEPVAGHRQG